MWASFSPAHRSAGLLKRRDAILELSKKLVAQKGEAAVLYP